MSSTIGGTQSPNPDWDGEVNMDKPLIVDIGTSFTRFGFAGGSCPSLSVPTVVGFPRGKAHMGMDTGKSVFVGGETLTHRAICQMSHPIQASSVESWSDIELIFKHAYKLLGVAAEGQPVIITESLKAKQSDRTDMAKMLFQMKVPGVWVVPQGVTGLFATGRSTGVVLDSGEGRSHAVAVVNGIALPAAKVTSSIGGAAVTEHLARLMSTRNISHREHFAEVKEEHCFVAEDYDTELHKYDANPRSYNRDHQLPDGTMVSLAKERFEAAELNFNIPRKLQTEAGRQAYDLPTAVVLAATATEECLRETMLKNIVAVGGNTLVEGFHVRLDVELNRRAALKEYWNRQPLKVNRISSNVSADECNWLGASMLGKLSTTKKLYTTEDHMKEEGMTAITRHRLAEFAK